MADDAADAYAAMPPPRLTPRLRYEHARYACGVLDEAAQRRAMLCALTLCAMSRLILCHASLLLLCATVCALFAMRVDTRARCAIATLCLIFMLYAP